MSFQSLAPLLAFSLLFSFAAQSIAQVYQWTDAVGTHFSDQPPPEGVQGEVRVQSESDWTQAQDGGNEYPNYDPVTMYATSWCGYCAKARKYFRENGIPYTEYDIEQDPEARRAYDALNGRGVPVILVKDRRLNGFSVDGFERIYNR